MSMNEIMRQAQDVNHRRIEQRMATLKKTGKSKPFYDVGRAARIAGEPFHSNESDGWCAGWHDADDEILAAQ